MERKFITPSVVCLIIGLIASAIFYSCTTNRTLAKTVYLPLTIERTKTVHDTIRPSRMSQAELDAYIKAQLRYNNETYIAPNFTKLIQVNAQQAAIMAQQASSLSGFESIIQSMRDRSIRRSDSMNQVSVDKDKKIDQLQQRYFKAQQEQQLKLQAQINDLKTITNFLLALWSLMFIGLIMAAMAIKIWWKRLSKKSTANV